MKTKFEDIVNVNYIGREENPIKMNDILRMANSEQLTPARQNKESVLLIGIDVQQDFMENGALGVPNSHKDVENLSKFIYNNIDKISQITISIDTHNPFQIFHPCWWIDENGDNPPPLTAITLADLDSGKWRAVINPIASREYVENLEKQSKKVRCALENQFANMVYFHSVAKKSMTLRLVKGQDPLSEMYGIIKPEYDTKNYINIDFLNKIESFNKIIIAGEAKDFCVYESIKQILEYYQNKPEVTKKIFILEDCCSSVMDTPEQSEIKYTDLKKKYNINIVDSTSLKL